MCIFCLPLVSVEEMLRLDTVGVNEQWLQDQSAMTDKVKELLSLSIWVKWQLLVKKRLRHWRALSSLWLKPNNSKLISTVQNAGDEEACSSWLKCSVILNVWSMLSYDITSHNTVENS